MPKGGTRKGTEKARDAGSEPRVNPRTNSCGLCGELFSDCAGHPELPGMNSNGQED